MINDILDISKIEAGKLELEHVELYTRDTIEDVTRLIAVQAHAKGLEITAHIDPSVPEILIGDPARVRQILLNLCGNAVKFTPRGEVAVSVKVLDRDIDSITVRFDLRDTGNGIRADRLAVLFRPFSQVDASTTRRFGRTGLGHPIVKQLAELMGGQVGVDSREGAGSNFWFTAHLRIAAGSKRLARSPPPALKGQRVLVVDDNATNRNVLAAQLARCGVEPVCVASAEEALRAMQDSDRSGLGFQAALLDYQMPDCDGAELGQRINVDPQLRRTRLVLLTSSGHRGDARRFAELGFAGCFVEARCAT